MELRRLQRLVIDALEDIKGQDIEVYNTTHLSNLFDRVILVSATSNRQTRALASHVAEKAKQAAPPCSASRARKPVNGCWLTWEMWWYISCSLPFALLRARGDLGRQVGPGQTRAESARAFQERGHPVGLDRPTALRAPAP